MSLTLKGLTIGYEKDLIIKDIDLQFKRGVSYIITGRNGVGKSTLLKTIAGILPPLKGSIQPTVQLDDWRLPGLKGTVLIEEHLGVFQHHNGEEILRRILPRRRMKLETSKEIVVNEIMEMLPIERKHWQKPLGKLSGGQRKIVGIGIALVGSPEVVLIDEIFSGVELLTRATIARSLRDICGKNESILIVVDQDITELIGNGFIRINLDAVGNGYWGQSPFEEK